MFDLDLNPASTQGHDAKPLDGHDVAIKLMQGRSATSKMQKNGQRPISLSKLSTLAQSIPSAAQLRIHRESPV
jgi:hypothetical protein